MKFGVLLSYCEVFYFVSSGFAINFFYCTGLTISPLDRAYLKIVRKYFKRSILYCNGNTMFQIEFYEINLIPFHQYVVERGTRTTVCSVGTKEVEDIYTSLNISAVSVIA